MNFKFKKSIIIKNVSLKNDLFVSFPITQTRKTAALLKIGAHKLDTTSPLKLTFGKDVWVETKMTIS